MFNNYLNDEKVYLELESFLKNFFLNFINCKESVDCPYYNTTFSNGKPFMDGNPIFSARKKNNGTIIKVVLDEDANSLSEFDKEVDGFPIHVIVANVSSLDSIKEKIISWYEKYN